mmetsp:Transcript_120987/g.301896  ORF Transcript_120987/g.301896 Transcript_120987/m.301896 type:complete len:275 (+) Transcript_120987:134-958(+)
MRTIKMMRQQSAGPRLPHLLWSDSPCAEPSSFSRQTSVDTSSPSFSRQISSIGSDSGSQVLYRLASRAGQLCSCWPRPFGIPSSGFVDKNVLLPKKDKAFSWTASMPEKRWYRVHQVDDLVFYVRRDEGPKVRIVSAMSAPDERCFQHGEPDQLDTPEKDSRVPRRGNTGLGPRKRSVPCSVDRFVGIAQQGFDRDAFSNDCRVCFESPAEVVLLPCRHCGLCQDCYRATLFSKPAHRGGRSCPFCRCKIREAIQLHRKPGGGAVQYGYSIDVS